MGDKNDTKMGHWRNITRCLPRSRWRRIVLCVTLAVLGVIVLSQTVFEAVFTAKSCSNQDSTHFLKWLCLAYKQGFVNGTLCPDLCSQKRMTYIKCLNYNGGKLILLMDWNGSKVILKTKEFDVPYSRTLPYVLGFSEGFDADKNRYPNWAEFRRMVIAELKQTIGYNGDKKRNANILRELWTINPEGSKPKRAKTTAMNSIWSLVQQAEFTFMKINQNWQFIPEILGTCGHFYAVELVKTDSLVDRSIFGSSQISWLQRAGLAIQMLTLVRDTQTQFAEGLHMCDVKQDNFGVSASGQLKAIDVDMFFLETRMKDEIMAVKNCSAHDDCSFFDCHGWCDGKSKECLHKRVNNNLQSVCAKILISSFQNGFSGLLQNPPPSIASELDRVLKQCAYPRNSPSLEVLGKAEQDIIRRLVHLLKSTVHAG